MEIINNLLTVFVGVLLMAMIGFVIGGSIAVTIMMWHEFKVWWRNKS